MAGPDNVSAPMTLLEENGCNAGSCSACDVIILSWPNQPVGAVVKDIAIGAGGFGFDFRPVPAAISVVKRTSYRCGRSGIRSVQCRQRLATAATFLCYPGTKSRRWTTVA